MKKNHWYFAVAIVGVLLAGGAYVVWKHPSSSPAVVYITAPVVDKDLESSVLAVGTLRAADLVSVGAQVSGQIKTMNVKLGDHVKKGQLITEIDSMTQVNALQTAEANLQSMQAQLRANQATLEQTRLALQRQQGMFSHDAGAQQDLETAQANYAVAQANVAAQQAQIASAKISVDTARVDLSYTRILAPIDGVIVAVLAVQGQTVNANQITPNLVKIAKLDTITVKAQISEADVIRVKPGQIAYFTILGDPDKRYETTLRAIEPAPDSIATDSATSTSSNSSTTSSANAVYYNGLMDVPNADGRLRIAMTAQVNIVLARVRHALTIPSASLLPGGGAGRGTVRLLDADGHPVTRAVTIGFDDNTSAQILTGLKLGDRVVLGESRTDAKPSPWSGGPF